MPRPTRCRRIGASPKCNYFKPQGARLSALDVVNLTVDELEAVRLADLQGHYQQCAAEKMGVSRQTFGRIIESAHKKIADALVNGKALNIEGGTVDLPNEALGFGRCGGGRNKRRCRGGHNQQEE